MTLLEEIRANIKVVDKLLELSYEELRETQAQIDRLTAQATELRDLQAKERAKHAFRA